GLLIPSSLILIVLLSLKSFVSPVYAPNRFFVGITFGVLAGFMEEIGWMGFAFRALSAVRSELSAAVLLGLLWGCGHFPVIGFLGTATPLIIPAGIEVFPASILLISSPGVSITSFPSEMANSLIHQITCFGI